jgi:hypothetical protein
LRHYRQFLFFFSAKNIFKSTITTTQTQTTTTQTQTTTTATLHLAMEVSAALSARDLAGGHQRVGAAVLEHVVLAQQFLGGFRFLTKRFSVPKIFALPSAEWGWGTLYIGIG